MYGVRIPLHEPEGVNRSDYYTDFLVEILIPFLKSRAEKLSSVLEIGTGRGYLSILFAKLFPSIRTIIATDIDMVAVQLATRNVRLNSADSCVTVVQGDLFAPVDGKKFDLIISVPPQLPLTKQQVSDLIPLVAPYHLTTSVGGRSGRRVIDKMIRLAPRYLTSGGLLAFVHSDLIGFPKTMEQLERAGFCATLLGTCKKLLQETTLTRLSRPIIETTGYRFRKDNLGRDFLNLGVFVGMYDAAAHQEHSASHSSDYD